MDSRTLNSLILSTIKQDARPIPAAIVASKIIDRNRSINKFKIYDAIDELVKKDELRKLANGKLVIGYENAPVKPGIEIVGTLNVTNKGDGFVIDPITELRYYVHKNNINGGLRGDEVLFAPLDKEPKNDVYDAKILKILTHNKNTYVGTMIINPDNTYTVKNDDARMYLNVFLSNPTGIVDGSKIWYQIDEYHETYVNAHVLQILGHKDDVGQDIESLVYDNGVDPSFPKEVLEYANNVQVVLTEEDKKVRRDLSARHIMSIDPETSKDLDDAIYVEKLANGNYFLGVSIADVSVYVPYQSAIDECALNRGTSIYLADRVIPMLPHSLCNDAGSLNANVTRMCITADMEIDPDGNIFNIDVYPAYMVNHDRLTYDGVNYYYGQENLKGLDAMGYPTLETNMEELATAIAKAPSNSITNPDQFQTETKQILNDAYALHKILRNKKIKDGYVDFEIPEPKIKLNDEGFPIEIVVKQRGTAQKMVEDFMIAANEAVTIKAKELNIPFIYRVHDKPDSEKMHVFNVEAKKFGFHLPSDLSNISSVELAKIIDNNRDNPNAKMLSLLMLRSMQKAEYSTNNIGHFGLASQNYTHFTSPIRRYPDLIVHRLFWMFLFTPDKYSDQQRHELMTSLGDICDLCNKTETISVRCERDVNSMKFAEFMTPRIGQQFDAMVSMITRFGMFVELLDNKMPDGTVIPAYTIEGLVSIKDMTDDFYSYDDVNFVLVGRNTHRTFSLGQKVRVICSATSKQERKISFTLVGA